MDMFLNMDKAQATFRMIEDDLRFFAPLAKLEQDVGFPLIQIVGAATTVGSLIASMIVGPGIVCNLTGIFYPAYASYKAIKSDEKDDDTQWVTYWVVFAFMTIIETFSEFILQIFPYYYFLKYLFVVWLFSPATFGADMIYKQVVKPFILQHQSTIENVAGVVDSAADVGLNATSEITDNLRGMVEEAVGIEQAPAEEQQVEEQAPAEEQAPVEEAPADPPVEDTPSYEKPAAEEAAPSSDDAPPAE